MGIVSRRKNPQWDDDDKHAQNVYRQDQAFDKGQLFRKSGVEKDGEHGNSNDEQRSVPSFWYVCIRFVEDYKALDDGLDEI